MSVLTTPLYGKTPQVVLVVGVNGSGKTTTIGKLASQFKAAGKTVVIAAGDTFRAAANPNVGTTVGSTRGHVSNQLTKGFTPPSDFVVKHSPEHRSCPEPAAIVQLHRQACLARLTLWCRVDRGAQHPDRV